MRLLGAAVVILVVISGGWAQSQPAAQSNPPSRDRLEKIIVWYANDENPVIQRVATTGRFQLDYATVDAEDASHTEWNVRRLRVGVKSTLFREFTLHAEADLNPQEADPFYTRMTDLYLQWSRSERLVVTAGKHGITFTLDGLTSSKELLTIDRNNLSNNLWFPQEYLPGVMASGEMAPWIYRAGVYSAGSVNREFGEFNGSIATLALAGYDFASSLGVSEALLTGNYVYQNPDVDNTFTRPFQHIGSVNFRLDATEWGLRTDLAAGAGYLGQSDLWGVVAMPFVNVTESFQAVVRHTYLKSEEPNGVQPATYENRIVAGRGDRYQEIYLGANYYIFDHKLKLQTGAQFADMNDRANDGGDYAAWSWTSGLRVSW